MKKESEPQWKSALRFVLPREDRIGWLRIHERRLAARRHRQQAKQKALHPPSGPRNP